MHKQLRLALVSSLAMLCGTGFAANSWEKATSLSVGDVVLLAVDNGTVAKELSGFSDTGTPYGTVEDYDGTPNGLYPLSVTAGSGEGSFAFKTSSDTYLSWNSGNSLKTDAEVAEASSWTIVFDGDGNATITNVEALVRVLQYNASNPRFACYTSSQTKPIIWKQVAEVEPDPDPQPESSWVAPTISGETPVDGGSYKVMNVGSGKILAMGKAWFSWSTTAIVAEDGFVATFTGDAASFTLKNGNQGFVFTSGNNIAGDAMHADGGNATSYGLTQLANGNYHIHDAGGDASSLCWGYNSTFHATGIVAHADATAEGWNCEWAFLPSDVDLNFVKMYVAKKALYEALVNAEKQGVDTDEASAVFANEEASVDDFNEAAAALKHATALVVNTKAVEGASATNGIETNFVVNGTFDQAGVVSPWVTTGGFQNQTTATNQQGAFTVPFFENWNGTANANKMYQVIEDIPNGNYVLKIAAFVNTFDASVQYVFANNDKVYLTAGDPTAYEVKTIVTNNKIEIGLEQTAAVANWMGIDNVSLVYYGEASVEEFVTAYNDALAAAQAVNVEGKMNADVKSAMLAAIAAEVDKTDINALSAATAALTEATSAATANIAAYAAAAEKLAAMKAFVEATNLYTAEALAAYYTQPAEKYEANTLTTDEANALQNPNTVTGWRNENTVDDLLMSVWDVEPMNWDSYHVNTWSTEGNTDGSEFKVPFIEYWTGDAESLGEKTLTATLNGVAPGNYAVSAWVRVRAKNGADVTDVYGISLVANEGEAVDVTEGEVIGETQFSLGQYTAAATVGEDGVLKIQFIVAADNNISWLSFKNVKFEVVIDKTALETAINNAKTAAEAMANANAKAFLETAIADAEAIYAADGKTQAEIDAAVTALAGKLETAQAVETYKFGKYALYSWESLAGIVCEKGGVISYENGDGNRLNYTQAGYYTICLNGKKGNMGDETASANAGYMLVTLDEALAEGDVINLSAFLNKDASKTASAWFVFENGTTMDSGDFGDEANINAAFNGVVTTKTLTVPAAAAGSKTIKITRGTAGTNLFVTKLEINRLPVDITLNVESGKDIATELAAAVEGKVVGNITINLAEGGSYTIGGSIVAPASLTINGNGATIDASALASAFINYASVTGEMAKKDDGTDSKYTIVENVTIQGVKIAGLSQSLINNGAGNVLFNKVLVDNSVVEIIGSNAIFALGQGYPEDLKVTNSTLWSKDGHTGFLFQAHGKAVDIKTTNKTSWTIDKSTLYQIAVGKKANNTNTFKGKNYLVVTLTNSLLYNFGSSAGNEVNGWLFGQNSTSPTITYANNAYLSADGVVSGWTDESKSGSDQTGTSIAAVVTFADAAAGDFNVTFAPAEGVTVPETVGDPRWTITVAGGGDEIADGIYDLTADMFLTWASHEATEGTATGCAFDVEKATQMVYGDSNVGWLNYANLSGYDKLVVIVSSGAPRFCFNRTADNAQDNDDPATSQFIDIPGHNWGTTAYQTVDEDNKRFIIDLKKMTQERGFAHLHAIKGANWSDVVVVSMQLIKGDVELPSGIESIAVVAAQKDGKFFIDGKLVIVRNGRQFNANGQILK